LPNVSELEPVSVAEAAEAMRSADRVEIGRTLSTARLDRILEHEPGDLTCIVEAGVRLSALAAHLAPHGQMLALDPPGDPTVGACLAADLSGPRRHRYGTMRDLVIGVTVVLADGTVASSGGKVVKNVAGYDLGKLFCGSRGRLGLIARLALRLHPRPPVSRSLVVPVGESRDAERLWQIVHRSQLVPSAADLLWPGALAIMFEGGESAVEAQVSAARGLVGGEEANVWDEARARQAASRGRIHFEPGWVGELLASQEEAVARLGAGVAYVPQEVPEEWPPLAERVRAAFDPRGVLS
jgi:glycolate dehydrogenase FAD-binding subunit